MIVLIVLNCNNAGQTISCIKSIQNFNSTSCRIVIVDNCSTDGGRTVLEKYLWGHRNAFELISSPNNGGYAQGNNVGLKCLENDPQTDRILKSNNDVLFTQDILPRMSGFLDSHPEAGYLDLPSGICRFEYDSSVFCYG